MNCQMGDVLFLDVEKFYAFLDRYLDDPRYYPLALGQIAAGWRGDSIYDIPAAKALDGKAHRYSYTAIITEAGDSCHPEQVMICF